MSDSDWSVPESEVLQGVEEILDGEHRGVLATIIAVEGSAYRRPGAKMVIPEEGPGSGHITAGCLEDELQRIAGEVLAAGEPRIERYDLRPDSEDDVWGLGVGCNGVLDILIEPIDESYRPVTEAVADDRDIGVVTVIEGGQTGTRAYYHPEDGELVASDGFPADLADRIGEAAAELTARGRADTVELDGTTVFVDGITSPSDLVVVGTGNDVAPIAEVGKQAGFRVTVVGFRGANATADRFPAADEVLSTSPARITETLDLDEDTYVVLATHNFVDDRLAVDELLGTDVPYVGLMGPRKRFEQMREEFDAEGRAFSEDELDSLYTPVGLDLGGGSPYQIALSIVSEVLAVANDREPQHLTERAGPIHDRVEVDP
ncbi:XdhC/CoxI family protein [Halovenus sp. WSH3]|uniref:XdhC/CoxI family protein n=1 Tax=Halovenus carboxidivorans TaxID=2692199 RepID=A0A6B0THZ4_9EURY|nr:XdhC/CoxI family protein [Halovenus carboxidivorans]MXR52829.1 XdhC/CoxI family protein [Halovenus carboxidivorans]